MFVSPKRQCLSMPEKEAWMRALQARKALRVVVDKSLPDPDEEPGERRMNRRRMPSPKPDDGSKFPFKMRDSIELMKEKVWPYVLAGEDWQRRCSAVLPPRKQ